MQTTTRWIAISAIVAGATLGACRVKTEGNLLGGSGNDGTGGGDSAGGGAGVTEVVVITDDSGREYKVNQGRRAAPGDIGCADGQREAFVDDASHPGIAGCLAAWPGTPSLRSAPTGAACGDDGGECASPGDACAPGWHVCGASGAVADLKQVSGDQCEHAGGGRFSAAISHCLTQEGCQYDHAASASYACFESGWCSEPVCCGDDCGDFGACTDGVWDKQTHIPVGTDQGCARASSARAGGILCCRG
jgi:hypothetical protein